VLPKVKGCFALASQRRLRGGGFCNDAEAGCCVVCGLRAVT
jgi:hypothetical protein